MGTKRLFSRCVVTGALALSLFEAVETRAEMSTNEINISAYLMRTSQFTKRDDSWKEFLDERFGYNLVRRFNTKSYLNFFSENDLNRTLPSELSARQLRNVVRHSSLQTLREELIGRSTFDDWLDDHIAEPVVDFVGGKIIQPIVRAITYPFRSDDSARKRRIEYRSGIVQDLLGGRVEQNQLVSPFSDEGIPGEERLDPLRLPENLALGARLGSNPYLYATAPLNDWYIQARFGAADILDRPHLSDASLLFLTELPHTITMSFGGRMPFKDEQEPEQYFGPHGFFGLNWTKVHRNHASREMYLELLAGENQGVFVGLNWGY